MLHRSGYASKENQEVILRIQIPHSGFLEILNAAVASQYPHRLFASKSEWQTLAKHAEAVYQWDPDRDILGNQLKIRTIQLGIRGTLLRKYAEEWLLPVQDVTLLAKSISTKNFVDEQIPRFQEYRVEPELAKRLEIGLE